MAADGAEGAVTANQRVFLLAVLGGLSLFVVQVMLP